MYNNHVLYYGKNVQMSTNYEDIALYKIIFIKLEKLLNLYKVAEIVCSLKLALL